MTKLLATKFLQINKQREQIMLLLERETINLYNMETKNNAAEAFIKNPMSLRKYRTVLRIEILITEFFRWTCGVKSKLLLTTTALRKAMETCE